MDNIIIAKEFLHNNFFIGALKIDISKAYDSTSWQFEGACIKDIESSDTLSYEEFGPVLRQ